MTKDKLHELTDKAFNEMHDTLQLIYDELNQGQRKKLLKNETIKQKFEHFGVETEDKK